MHEEFGTSLKFRFCRFAAAPWAGPSPCQALVPCVPLRCAKGGAGPRVQVLTALRARRVAALRRRVLRWMDQEQKKLENEEVLNLQATLRLARWIRSCFWEIGLTSLLSGGFSDSGSAGFVALPLYDFVRSRLTNFNHIVLSNRIFAFSRLILAIRKN